MADYIKSADFTRYRKRATDVDFETCLDHFSHMIATWSKHTLAAVLESLLPRSPIELLEHVVTSTEPLVHRNNLFGSRPMLDCSGSLARPLSTPHSRDLRAYIKRTRNKAVRGIHRSESCVLHSQEEATHMFGGHHATGSWATPVTRLPPEDLSCSHSESSLRPHSRPATMPPILVRGTAISGSRRSKVQDRPTSSPPASRRHTLSATPNARRHTLSATPNARRHILSATPSARRHTLSATPSARRHTLSATPTSPRGFLQRNHSIIMEGQEVFPCLPQVSFSDQRQAVSVVTTLPLAERRFLAWFADMLEGWQQLQVLQVLLHHMDSEGQLLLSALLMVKRFRDFIACLPKDLAERTLLYLPPRDILTASHVCRTWRVHCRSEAVWRVKCRQGQLALPLAPSRHGAWRELFMQELALRRNWRSGIYKGRVLHGHSRSVVSVSVKGNVLASGSLDRSIRVWDLRSGQVLRTLRGHQRGVWALCFHGKNLLVSGSHDHTIKIWNLESGQCERTLLAHQGPVWSVRCQKDELVSASQDYSAILWSIRHCRFQRQLLGHRGAVFAADLDSSAKLACTASGDKTIGIWSVSTGQRMQTLRVSRTDPVMSVQWRQDLILCCHGNKVSCFDCQSGNRVVVLSGHEDSVKGVSLLAGDGKDSIAMAVSCSTDGRTKVWSCSNAKCVSTLKSDSAPVNCVASNGIVIVSGSSDGAVKVWDFNYVLHTNN